MQRDDASKQDPSLFVTQANFDPNPSGDFDWENMLEGQNSMWAADGNARGGDSNESSMERAIVERPDGGDVNGIMNSLFSTTGMGSGFMSKLPSSSTVGALSSM